jgi:HdeA/HdeB family protein
MQKMLIWTVVGLAMMITCPMSRAQVDLSAYADAEGFLDVQTLTCAQLANTWQGDADRLTAWYSGWYNGLAKKHFMDIRRGKEAEHEVIVYCKANPEIKIIQAIEIVFKSMRERAGIKVQ